MRAAAPYEEIETQTGKSATAKPSTAFCEPAVAFLSIRKRHTGSRPIFPMESLYMLTRRHFLRTSTLLSSAGLLGPLPLRARANPSAFRNVLWIIADDMGYGDLSSTGRTQYTTPHIDRIGQEGVTMERAYVYPVCTATRAAFLTGRSPQRHGLESVLLPGYTAGLPEGCPNAAREFRSAGFRTGLIGKWHLGDQPHSRPNAQGFDDFFGFLWGETDYFRHTKKFGGIEHLDFFQNESRRDVEGYTTELYGNRAVQFLRENRERPFFLCLAYNAPHYYLTAPRDSLNDFSGPPEARLYAAVMTALDDSIGRVLDELARLRLDRSTLVIFTSDNGAPLKSPGTNQPFRGGKNELAEGGIRSPLMARLPGVIPAGHRCAENFAAWDLLPTSLALAGVAPTTTFEGDNLEKLMTQPGSTNPHPRCFRYTGPNGKVQRAVLKGPWKLLQLDPSHPGALYHLHDDPRESHDRSSDEPARRSELAADWNSWAASFSPGLGFWQTPGVDSR